MDDLRSALLTLQELDEQIANARATLASFEPQLAEIERPVSQLELEMEATRNRLEELRNNIRRLEKGAEQKRGHLKQYESRMERIRNVREESALRTEMDLIRRAAEADETEALELMEQATRTDLKLDDLQRNLDKARAEMEPKRDALLAERANADQAVGVLTDKRKNHAVRLDAASLRLYERVRAGRSSVALAPLTQEGACGHCFNILPLQAQSEIRNGRTLYRCEACGVILYPA